MSTQEKPAPLGGPIWNNFTVSLGLLVATMLVITVIRFANGIGAVTNLNDGYPWGLWIVYDDVIGSALGAGGFTVAFLTYILNRGEFHPIVRPALLAALFGYSAAAFSVLLDIGRPWAGWHMFWPSYVQTGSVMMQVALCIGAYIALLALALSPILMEKYGWTGLKRKLNRVLFIIIALGVVVPTMHQASLGSLLVVLGPQLNPLYRTDMLPLLFLTSSLGMGIAAVVFEGTISALAFKRPLERELLGKLTFIGAVTSCVFVALRLGDVAVRGEIALALQPTFIAGWFWLENACFIASMVLVVTPASRLRPRRLFLAAASMAVGGLLYRLGAYFIAYETGAGWKYFPSIAELGVTVGLIAFEILAITIAIRRLPILPQVSAEESRT